MVLQQLVKSLTGKLNYFLNKNGCYVRQGAPKSSSTQLTKALDLADLSQILTKPSWGRDMLQFITFPPQMGLFVAI